MSEIVEQLREKAKWRPNDVHGDLHNAAADEIDRLRAALKDAEDRADLYANSRPVVEAARTREPVAWWAYCEKTGGQMVKPAGLKNMLIEDADRIYADDGGYVLRPLVVDHAQPKRDRQATASLVRDYLQKKYGTAAVQMSSDGMERIYYNGIPLLDISDALAMTSTEDK